MSPSVRAQVSQRVNWLFCNRIVVALHGPGPRRIRLGSYLLSTHRNDLAVIVLTRSALLQMLPRRNISGGRHFGSIEITMCVASRIGRVTYRFGELSSGKTLAVPGNPQHVFRVIDSFA